MDVQAMIDAGVPEAPSLEAVGDEWVPVAVWHRGDVAAVLVIGRDDHADEECSGWAQDVQFFTRRDDTWDLEGAVGSCWPLAYGDRPGGTAPQRTGFASGRPGVVSEGWLVSCVAPVGTTEVTVVSGAPRQQLAVEPVTGAFLVEADEPSPDLRFEVRGAVARPLDE